MSYYVSILLTYFFIDAVAALGLDLQVGLSDVLNFGFILFQSIGAYTVAVLTLGPSSKWFGTQTYFHGWTLPFPVPFIFAVLVGVAFSFLMGILVLRRLRSAYQAVVMLSLMLVCYDVVEGTPSLFNGTTGLGSIPHPLHSLLQLSSGSYQWAYTGFCGVLALIVFLLMRIVYRSPYGRLLAAMREGDRATEALGVNTFHLRLTVLMTGGGLAALSGAMLVGSVAAWSTNSWSFFETVVYFAAITLGGVGNGWGTLFGVAVLQIGIMEGVSFVPQFGPPGFVYYLQQALIGIVLIAVLWLRPQGLLPERRPRLLGDRPQSSLLGIREPVTLGSTGSAS